MSNSIWKFVHTKVGNFSGFNCSHHRMLTQKVGLEVPIFVDEVVPNQNSKLSLSLAIELPPFAFDFFGNINYCVEAFFIPTRLLMGGYEYFYANQKMTTANTNTPIDVLAPVFSFANYGGETNWPAATLTAYQAFINNNFVAQGTLADYLGFRQPADWFNLTGSGESRKYMSLLPFIAYWRIIDDWYRNAQIERPYFRPLDATQNITAYTSLRAPACPWIPLSSSNYMFEAITGTGSGAQFTDVNFRLLPSLGSGANILNFRLFDLAHRNWSYDPFTTAQASSLVSGSAQRLEVTTIGGTDYISIPGFYGANAIQMFLNRNNLASPRLQDQVHARTGANLENGVAQRAILLGAHRIPIISFPVEQTSMNVAGTQNPFNSVGNKYGDARGSAQDLTFKFHADEPGYLFVLGSVVPDCVYSYGVNPLLLRYIGVGSITDMADSNLEMAGPHELKLENIAAVTHQSNYTFGYQDPYWSFKSMLPSVHGLFRYGESLDSAVSQRALDARGAAINISTDFLKIRESALDNVTAVQSWLSQYGAMVDVWADYRKTLPVHAYRVPSLVDPAFEHGHDVTIQRAGTRIS